MPEITIHIGGRDFEVVCKSGEEPFLKSAAALLDIEAQALAEVMGRIPESRMLLMAGLMLADKTASLEDQLAAADRENAGGPIAHEVSAEIKKLKDDLAKATGQLKESQDALAEEQKLKAAHENNTQTALAAMERMVASLEEKGVA